MDIKNARLEINRIDEEIVHLLERRLNVVQEIGKYKKENNLPVYDEKREKEVIEKCVSYLTNKELSKQIQDIYTQVMNSSKELE